MALRVARGLFRLWLVLSVLWITGVGVATWWTFPLTLKLPTPVPTEKCPFDPDAFLANRPQPQPPCWPEPIKSELVHKEQHAAIRDGIFLALAPPLFVLALGSALGWAFRGFR
jgi:hypothetical protein